MINLGHIYDIVKTNLGGNLKIILSCLEIRPAGTFHHVCKQE